MEKFKPERIEILKIQFYTVVGRLELEKEIKICSQNLQTFENCLLKCISESEAASCILGAIRRYETILNESAKSSISPAINLTKTISQTTISSQVDVLATEAVHIETMSKLSSSCCESAMSEQPMRNFSLQASMRIMRHSNKCPPFL